MVTAMYLKVLFFIAVLSMIGCSTSTVVNKNQFSGFLSTYQNLNFDIKRNAYRWIDSDAIRHYHGMIIDPVQVYPSAQANSSIAQQATTYLEKKFTKTLMGRKKLKNEAGNNILRLRAAITGVSKQTEGFKAYEILPIAAVYKGIQAAAGERASYIDVNLELELIDSQKGKVVAAFVEKAIGDTNKRSSDQFEFSDTKPTLDRWVVRFDRFIESNIH